MRESSRSPILYIILTLGVLIVLIAPMIYFSVLSKKDTNNKLKIVTSFTVIRDIAQNIVGDVAQVVSITKPGAEIHTYQPTTGDIKKIQGASLILQNGLELEHSFERYFEDQKVPRVVIAEGIILKRNELSDDKGLINCVDTQGNLKECLQKIDPIPIDQKYDGSNIDCDKGVIHYNQGAPNPHAWMSLENAIRYVNNIKAALIYFDDDPKHKEIYAKNASAYIEKIKILRNKLLSRLDKIPPEKKFLVTSEGAFSYLARDLNMKELYLWSVNSEQQATPDQVRTVVDTMKKCHIPVIFSESTISDKAAKQVAMEANARYGGVLYVDSLSEPNGPVPTYLDLLEKTVETIAQGFEE